MVFIKDANVDIHIHPFLKEGWNSLEDVLTIMGRKNLDAIALEMYNSNMFGYVVAQAKRLYPPNELVVDDAGVIFPGNRIVFNAKEYDTREKIHMLTVGWEYQAANGNKPLEDLIEVSLEQKVRPLVVLDHPFVDNTWSRTAGHINQEKEAFLHDICRKYSGQIAVEWNGYSRPWMRAGLRLILNLIGQKTDYHDVNIKAEQLTHRLNQDGYNIPLLADTDLHARNRLLLREMGAARFIVDAEGDTPKELLASMKANIFGGNYQNRFGYVSSLHLLLAYCVPILFPQVFYKPRA